MEFWGVTEARIHVESRRLHPQSITGPGTSEGNPQRSPFQPWLVTWVCAPCMTGLFYEWWGSKTWGRAEATVLWEYPTPGSLSAQLLSLDLASAPMYRSLCTVHLRPVGGIGPGRNHFWIVQVTPVWEFKGPHQI